MGAEVDTRVAVDTRELWHLGASKRFLIVFPFLFSELLARLSMGWLFRVAEDIPGKDALGIEPWTRVVGNDGRASRTRGGGPPCLVFGWGTGAVCCSVGSYRVGS